MFQHITISGYQAGEARSFEAGNTNGLSVPILVNEYQGRDREDRLTRFNVTLWGKFATAMEKSFIKKNDKYQSFTIIGTLRQDKPYTRNNGELGRTLNINANSVNFGGTGVNSAIIMGRIGYDAELRYTQSGTAVTNTTIYVNEYAGKDSDGKPKYRDTKFKVTIWGKRAESLVGYLKKGTQILANGNIISSDPYTTNNGEAAANIDLWAQDITIVSKAQSNGSDNSQTDDADPMDDMFDNMMEELGGQRREEQHEESEYDDIPF
jgi:single stranded DNA-binding protein